MTGPWMSERSLTKAKIIGHPVTQHVMKQHKRVTVKKNTFVYVRVSSTINPQAIFQLNLPSTTSCPNTRMADFRWDRVSGDPKQLLGSDMVLRTAAVEATPKGWHLNDSSGVQSLERRLVLR